MQAKSATTIYFIYDGDCPICQLGAKFYRIRATIGELHSIDARCAQQHPVLQEIKQAGLSLDEGMVIKYQEQLYQGQDALHLMATLGAAQGWFNRLNTILFKKQTIANFCYPFLKAMRNLLLKLKGIDKINNLE